MLAAHNIAPCNSFACYCNAGGMGAMQADETNQPNKWAWLTTTSRYYVPSFEREVSGGQTTDYTYIESPNGLVAAIKTTGTQHDVIPTPGIDGTGLQRIIIGNGGEIWYSPDHYETFYRIK